MSIATTAELAEDSYRQGALDVLDSLIETADKLGLDAHAVLVLRAARDHVEAKP